MRNFITNVCLHFQIHFTLTAESHYSFSAYMQNVQCLQASLNMTLTLSRFVRRVNKGVLCFIVSYVAVYVKVTGRRKRLRYLSSCLSAKMKIFEFPLFLLNISMYFCIFRHLYASLHIPGPEKITKGEHKNKLYEIWARRTGENGRRNIFVNNRFQCVSPVSISLH